VLGGFLAAPLAAAKRVRKPKPKRIDPRIGGVTIGLDSYSFRDRTLDEALPAMQALGIGLCELWQGHVEPKDLSAPKANRDDLRRWRLKTPLEDFRAMREKFDAAGIEIHAYSVDVRKDFTDPEIERTVLTAQALGASVITTSPNVSVVKRLDFFASQHRLRVGLHNHSEIREDEIATPDSLQAAIDKTRATGVSLDLGHMTAAGFDPVDFLERHHQQTFVIHLKDRKREQGPSVAWGEGDTPIARTLQLLHDRKWAIPALIEYEYSGKDAIDEVRRCLDFCRQALR
jgi:sugar phosphate isomerase/epimerase